MKKDIVLCGVGGDGIVSVAKIISDAALNMGLNLKQSEIHGMSQRGGSVFSHLRLSSEPIFADVIPEGQADIILSSEPMEALRYLPWLAKDGWIITNNEPFVNIKNYPDMELVNAELGKIKNLVSFNASEIAKAIKARSNMVLLGATVPYLDIELGKVTDFNVDLFSAGLTVGFFRNHSLLFGWQCLKNDGRYAGASVDLVQNNLSVGVRTRISDAGTLTLSYTRLTGETESGDELVVLNIPAVSFNLAF